MTLDDFKFHCLSKPSVTDEYPMKGDTVWMKVAGKMFALANVEALKMEGRLVPPFHFINLKCDPQNAILLRDQYPAIKPGWHQNKAHWNSMFMDGSLDDTLIRRLIDQSYDIVVAGLPRKTRDALDG